MKKRTTTSKLPCVSNSNIQGACGVNQIGQIGQVERTVQKTGQREFTLSQYALAGMPLTEAAARSSVDWGNASGPPRRGSVMVNATRARIRGNERSEL
jgi:hypothetical protein